MLIKTDRDATLSCSCELTFSFFSIIDKKIHSIISKVCEQREDFPIFFGTNTIITHTDTIKLSKAFWIYVFLNKCHGMLELEIKDIE